MASETVEKSHEDCQNIAFLVALAFAVAAAANLPTILGTLTSSDRGDPEINAEFEVRAFTGVGAEKAVASH